MIRFCALFLAVVIGGVSSSRPVSAQHGPSSSRSLTHVVSVTVPSRVKVRAAPLALVATPAKEALAVTRTNRIASALGVSVRASQAWVLSIRSGPRVSKGGSARISWASSPAGTFSRVTAGDTVLAAGTRAESHADTAIFFEHGERAGAAGDDSAVFLTVAAP
jgi:hypothetical protein